MSHLLISRNNDLLGLRNEGFTLSVQSNHLVIDDIPFIDPSGNLKIGRMVCQLAQSGGTVMAPNSHIMYWAGPEPHDHNVQRLHGYHSVFNRELAPGLKVDHQFSVKIVESGVKRGYKSYYEKITTYAKVFSGPATAVDSSVTPRVFRAVRADEGDNSPFQYPDTASARAGIAAVSARFCDNTVAIIGLGGTGSYILDLVAKTPVKRILLFDDDDFLQHNAFRSPGAAPYAVIEARENKAVYFGRLYSEIHSRIVTYPIRITEENLSLLDEARFVFVAIDHGPSKERIFSHLESSRTPFIDVGLGVSLTDENQLTGQLRTTLSTDRQRDHLRDNVSTQGPAGDNEYSSNIQVSDLNALNAALAVVRWKRFLGFYHSSHDEHHSLFRIRDAAHLRTAFPGQDDED